MVDTVFQWIYRILFIVVVCSIFAGGRCATTRGAGEIRADAIVTKAEAIETNAQAGKKIVNSSSATPEEKKQLNQIFDSMATDSQAIREPVKQLGKDVDVNKEIADDRQKIIDSLKKYRNIVIGAVISAALGMFVWFKFLRK